MDQKNTIVKCTANPACLFNHNGICDNYVITIGADKKCQEYVETARIEEIKKIAIYKPGSEEPLLTLYEPQRCQRAKINTNQSKKNKPNISDHLCDIKCISAHYAEDGELYCQLIQNFPERPLRCSAYDDGGNK